MLYYNENDLNSMIKTVKKAAANKCNRKSVENFSDNELDKIISNDLTIKEITEDFIESYKKWMEFHLKIENEKKWGNLNEKEIIELGELIQSREIKREKFIKALE